MSYIPFSRKYRPQVFDELVGQEHITTTLKNAILQNRVANAYLFAGPRGTGKTSTARIFAKSLNCEKGPTVSPCNKCIACNEITQGNSLDVLEIDGASNRGIDEVRTLRENVRFSPSRGRFKVYIIDEVHMLTTEAFNALLKTLEEPPSHVKFFFATTSPHKVIPTVLSRCQRFDFRRIDTSLIVEKIGLIAKKENIDFEDSALFVIAQASDGSLRDAESLLDQIASFRQGKVSEKDAVEALGFLDKELLFELAENIIHKDAEWLLKKVNSLIQDGCDIMQLNLSLMEHFRNLLLCKFEKDLTGLIERSNEYIERLKLQSRKISIEDGMHIFQVLSNADETLKRSGSARIQFEVVLVRLARRSDISSIDKVIDKLSDLEKRIKNTEQNKTKEEYGAKDVTDTVNNCQTLTIEMVKEVWAALIDTIGKEKISLGSYLSEGQPIEFDGESLLIGIPKEFTLHKEILEKIQNKNVIEQVLKELLGREKVSIKFIIIENLNNKTGHQKPMTPERGQTTKNSLPPIVESAMKIFDAKFTRSPHRATD